DLLCEKIEGGSDAWSLQGCYVLVVEDDPLMRSALVDTLEGWGMLVEAVRSAESALEVVRGAERLFDVLLSDCGCDGGVDGVQLIRALRDEQGRRTPAVIVSGQVGLIDSRRLESLGVRAISKPIDATGLRKELEACWSVA